MSTETNKRQKTDVEDMDDLFAEETSAPVVTNAKPSGAAAVVMDASLQIPDGMALAYNPGKSNSCKVKILGAAFKRNHNGPTSVKATVQVLTFKMPGTDILRAGPLMAIALSKNDKVKTETGIDVNARLIPTDMTPVLNKSTDIVSITLTLGKIKHEGLKEKAVNDLSPGAEVDLTDVYFSTSGMGSPWLTCTDFKVIKTMPYLDGLHAATDTVAKAGDSLVVSAALNSVAFRKDAAPTPEMQASFDAVKEKLGTAKTELAATLTATFPNYITPSDPLRLEDSEVQVAPLLSFNRTKIPLNKDPTKGVLFDDTKCAVFYKRTDDGESLTASFAGGAIVASTFGAQRSYADSTLSGQMHVLPTKQAFIPSIGLVDSGFGPKQILVVDGPTMKVPFAVLAAPFGVNERITAELLMANLLPNASMAFMPSKAKIYQQNYGKSDYIQDVYIESSDQFTVDILSSLRTAALRISHDTVSELYDGAEFSTTVNTSGDSLIDMMGGDRKPKVSTLVSGGVVSLREASVEIADNTLEFYAVVPNMMQIVQAAGNVNCGTDSKVGDVAFLAAGSGSIKGCAAMLKKGEIAVFAVRVKAKTTAVAAN